MGQNSLPIVVDTSDAWGYHSPDDYGSIGQDSLFRKYVYFHNGLNAASIVVSPIAGLIRIITAVFLLHEFGTMEQTELDADLAATRRFLKMQAGRGVMELFFLGTILGSLVDGIMTCKHKNLCCFQESS